MFFMFTYLLLDYYVSAMPGLIAQISLDDYNNHS